MTIDTQVRNAVVAEIERQATLPERQLTVERADDGYLRVRGAINLDELVMAVVGSLAGGP